MSLLLFALDMIDGLVYSKLCAKKLKAVISDGLLPILILFKNFDILLIGHQWHSHPSLKLGFVTQGTSWSFSYKKEP